MSDQELLNKLINEEDEHIRSLAYSMLTRRIRSQRVNRSITLIKGNLQLLRTSTRAERREQARLAYVKFKLQASELTGVDFTLE